MSGTGSAAALEGARFYKMSGSGNDFVFFDVRGSAELRAADPRVISALCARGTGVGADGVVFLDQTAPGVVSIVYHNSDGSRASLCGNATLCAARLSVELGAARSGESFCIRTDDGELRAWVDANTGPAFELRPVAGIAPDAPEVAPARDGHRERRIGYADTGVPHLVVRVDEVDEVALVARGAELRRAVAARPEGANVNFVSPAPGGRWRMRTFERGVEGETLACGTGAVACAALLQAWAESDDGVELVTRSGRTQSVTFGPGGSGPVLRGEGRLVYEGTLRNWTP